MPKYIAIAELDLLGRKVYTYREDQLNLLNEFEETLKSHKITYEIWVINEFGFCEKLSGEKYD